MTTTATDSRGPFDLDDPPAAEDTAPANGTAPAAEPKPSRRGAGILRAQRTAPLPEQGKAPADPPDALVAVAAGNTDPEDTNGWPRDALQLWPKIIDWLGSKGIGPEEVDISPSRAPIGPFKGESVDLSIIRGKTVAGSGSQSAAEALQQYVVDVLHAAGGDGQKVGCGPAVYTFKFFYRRGGGTIKEGKLELASYQELIRARERATQLDARAEVMQEGAAPLPPLGFGRQGQVTYPQPAAPAAAAPVAATAPAVAPPAPQVDVQAEIARQTKHEQQIADLRVELAIARMQAEQTAAMANLRQEFQARMAPPVAPVNEEQIAVRVTTAVTQALVAAGVLKPDGTPAAAPGAAPAHGDSLDDLLGTMERAEKIKKRLRNIVGSDEDDEPPARPQQIVVERSKEEEEKNFVAKAIQYVMKNPGIVQTILDGAGSAFEGSPAGEALKKVASMAGAAQAAKNASQSVPMPTSTPTGWRAPSA